MSRELEEEFVPPRLADDDNPLADIRVSPMEGADLPEATEPPPGLWVHASLILLVLLALQFVQSGKPEPAPPFQITALNMRPHSDHPGALRMNAMLSNPTDSALPYPQILVHFSNRYSERLSQGMFQPSDYLRGDAEGQLSFPANTRLQLALDLQDPGPQAVNYGLQLYSVKQR